MKINIQNMDVRPVELDEQITLEFISPLIKGYYPNKASVHVHIEKIKKKALPCGKAFFCICGVADY